jgi:hypothetical protein
VRAFGFALCAFLAVLSAVPAARAQCTLRYALTNGQIADASQVMANFNALANCIGPGGATNSIQYNNGGLLGGVGPLSNGQLVIGASGQAPQAQGLTAGTGVAIANGSGGISIAATGTEAGHGLYSRLMSQTPTSAGTGLITWLNQGSATVADNAVGVTIDAPSSGGSTNLIGRYMAAPTAPYTITALIAVTRNSNSGNGVGIGWYDGSAKLHVLTLGLSLAPVFRVDKWTNPTTYSGSDFTSSGNVFAQPIWLQLTDDGTNVSVAFSQDGSLFVTLFSVAKASGFLGAAGYSNLVFFANPQGSRTCMTLVSWVQS